MTAWNNANCYFAMAPRPWKDGNGTADANTGNFPSYPNNTYPLPYSGFGAGYGYLTAIGKVRFDGANDCFPITGNPGMFNDGAAFSCEFWAACNSVVTPVAGYVCQLKKISAKDMAVGFINYVGYKSLIIAVGTAGTCVTFGSGVPGAYDDGVLRHYLFTYSGAGWSTIGNYKLYVNGAEQALANSSVTNLAANSFIGARDSGSYYFPGDMYWFALYSRVIGAPEAANNYALGSGMGLRGTNTTTTMALANKVKSGFPYAMFMKGA